jgi:hypothetical protein
MPTPIFILGNPRSGSSAVSTCLRNVLNIQGYNEGHFLKYITKYENITNEIFNNLSISEKNKNVAMGNIDKNIFLNNIFLAFKKTYESLFDDSKKYWMDKTPDSNLSHIKRLLYLWPNSKFIILKRRSLENIQSRTIKFPNVSFDKHCKSWNNLMKSWYHLDKSILKNNYIEIEHYDMLFNLDKVAEDLVRLLPEYRDKKQSVIDFFNTKYPQSTTGKKPEILDIDSIGWTDSQKNIHNNICGETLNLYNYSLDKNYFKANTK